MISGASPVPKIQLTLTDPRFSTANSVITTASTTSPVVRATSRRLRLLGGPGACSDIAIRSYPFSRQDLNPFPRRDLNRRAIPAMRDPSTGAPINQANPPPPHPPPPGPAHARPQPMDIAPTVPRLP